MSYEYNFSGEKVDIHVMNDGGGAGDWVYLSTQITDKTGRIIYTIPPDKAFSYGIHHVKMVVRWVITLSSIHFWTYL